jgi:ribonuclease P protein subunit POP4
MSAPKAVNLLNHELIGLESEVVSSTNPFNIGIHGEVIDETMQTILIKNQISKRIQKRGTIFKFKLNDETVTVDGDALLGRPEDRVKKTNRRRW